MLNVDLHSARVLVCTNKVACTDTAHAYDLHICALAYAHRYECGGGL